MGKLMSTRLDCHSCGGELWEVYGKYILDEYPYKQHGGHGPYAIMCDFCELIGPLAETLDEAYIEWVALMKTLGYASDE